MNDLIVSTLTATEEITDLYKTIDDVIQRSVDAGDPEIALSAGKQLIHVNELSGLGLARLAYQLYNVWDEFDWGDNFLDTACEYWNVHPHTLERYVKIPKLFDEVPENVKAELENKGINLLIPIANANSQGYEFTDENWKDLIDAKTEAEVREIIRDDIKHAEPRNNALRIYISRDGNIQAFKGNAVAFTGFLDVNSDDPIVQQAVERIINNSGMLKG